jgi:hypothetical protein
MAKITLDIEDKNLNTVLTILQSIKNELITTIKVDEAVQSKKPFKYVPKNGIKKRVSMDENSSIKGVLSLKDDYKKI